MKRKLTLLILAGLVLAGGIIFALTRRSQALVLTGVVTTDEVILSSEIQGRIQRLLVNQGDTVQSNELVAVLQPQELKADEAFYANSAEESGAQVTQAQADLKFLEAQTSNQIRQAEATLGSTEAQVTQGEADLENARLTFARQEELYHRGVESVQTYDQARTAYEGLQARVASLRQQVKAAQAAVALARANGDQVDARRAALQATIHQLAAVSAQKEKANVRLNYTEIHSPAAGIVDVRAALQGEVVTPGQAIVTLVNPDNLWIRIDIEETYIDRIRIGDQLGVRFPSGATRQGTVFYRGVDAEYATQRDVSRSKRDIKTFEIRLRCDNTDRRLALGMTAYVALPLQTR